MWIVHCFLHCVYSGFKQRVFVLLRKQRTKRKPLWMDEAVFVILACLTCWKPWFFFSSNGASLISTQKQDSKCTSIRVRHNQRKNEGWVCIHFQNKTKTLKLPKEKICKIFQRNDTIWRGNLPNPRKKEVCLVSWCLVKPAIRRHQ